MKEQTRNTEVQINEEEIGKLSEKEFRIMIVKMIKNLENKMEQMLLLLLLLLSRFSHVQLFATPWPVAYQAPLVHGIFQAPNL